MRHLVRLLALLAAIALLLPFTSSSASAETPEPVGSATALPEIPIEELPTVAPEPTVPPSAKFSGSAWVNAQPSFEKVTAQIGDAVCGETTPGQRGGGPPSFYTLYVVSDNEIPGCGRSGSTITFFIGGKRANETAEWQASDRILLLRLVVGPPFAMFSGDVTLKVPPLEERVVPFIGEKACGYQLNPWMGTGPMYGYSAVVYPKELEEGCGFDGAEVTFKLVNKETGKVTAEAMGKVIWRPMAADANVNLTFTSVPVVQVPVAGGGGKSGTTWAPLIAACAVLSSAGVGALFVKVRSKRRAA